LAEGGGETRRRRDQGADDEAAGGNGAADAGDGGVRGSRVGGRDRLAAARLERGAEGMHSVVLARSSRERVASDEGGGCRVSAGELDGAGIARGDVAVMVKGCHGDVELAACSG